MVCAVEVLWRGDKPGTLAEFCRLSLDAFAEKHAKTPSDDWAEGKLRKLFSAWERWD
jgi:hypothetical protein